MVELMPRWYDGCARGHPEALPSKGDFGVPGYQGAMPDELPIVLALRLPPTGAGAIDTEVYCVNTTAHTFRVAVTSTGFSTIDDDGTPLYHGSKAVQVTLRPGDLGQIGDVVAWEWDGHVGLVIEFSNVETGYACRATYNLKHGIAHRAPDLSTPTHHPATKYGYVIPVGVVKELAPGS
jgi:hypothetical protein